MSGTSIFSSTLVASVNTAWMQLLAGKPYGDADFPIEAKRGILAGLGWTGSGPLPAVDGKVIAGFFYRDNNGDGSFTAGEELSATLLGAPSLDGTGLLAKMHWNCFWFEGVEPGREYELVFEADGVERFSATVPAGPGLNVAHIRVRPTKPLVYVVSHSHVDPEWLKTYEAYMADELPHMVERLELLREDPAHGFCLDEECAARLLVERYPALTDELRQRVLDGMVEPKAIVTAGDLTMPLGESMIRQITHGELVLRDMIGADVTTPVFWSVDCYGVCFQLPQILAKAGRPYFLMGEYRWFPPQAFKGGGPADREWFQKGRWEEGNPHYKEDMPFSNERVWDHREFFMQALDGTKVLVHRSPYWVPGGSWIPKVNGRPSHLSAFKFYGWDFAAPDRELTGTLAGRNREKGECKCIVATAPQFFKAIERSEEIPTFTTEAWMGWWTGSYESRVRARQMSRRLEYAMLAMESFACMARAHGMATPDRERFESWYQLLINHHHDPQMTPMGPSLIDEVVDRYREVEARMYRLFPRGLPDRIKGDSRPGVPFAVFNPLPWPVSRVVRAAGGHSVTDHEGAAVQAQADGIDDLERESVRFLARDLPAMGWRTYYVGSDGAGGADEHTAVRVDGETLENERIRVTLEDGLVRSITDRRTGQSLVEAGDDAFVNEIFVWEDDGCICEIKPKKFAAEARFSGKSSDAARRSVFPETGPARAVAETTFELSWGVFDQRVILEAGAAVVKFETRVDWKPGEGGRRVRVAFPTSRKDVGVLRDTPFAVVDEKQGHTIKPVNGWLGVASGGCGAALIHQGTCSIQAESDTMWMTLFRSVRASEGRCESGWDIPGDHSLEAGRNEYVYWLYPFAGDWKSAGVARVAGEVNTPVPAFEVNRSGSNDRLPAEESLVSVEPEVLAFSAFKPADDRNGYILRLFNPGPDEVDGVIRVGMDVGGAEETDFREKKTDDLSLEDGRIALRFGPYEIKTVRLV
ncbi:MAG: glycosyl hydrolase-related protein [Planctomycetota bacterium]